MSTIELTITGDIQKLRLKKDDVVVIKVKNNISMEQSTEINKQAHALFPNNRIVIMPENIDISVVGS